MYNYDYSNLDRYASSASTFMGMAIGFAIFVIILAIAIAVLMIIAYWKMFKKAGKNGWEAIIPYYNSWTLNDISGAHWIWWIVLIVSTAGVSSGLNIKLDSGITLTGVGAVASMCRVGVILSSLVIAINVAKKFGKTTAFGVLCAIFPFIGYPIIAFGSSKYDKDAKVAPHGIFDRAWNKEHAKEVKKNINACPKCNEKVTKTMNNCPNCGTKLK